MFHGNIVYFNEMFIVAIGQLNICVAISPISMMWAVAKQSVATVSKLIAITRNQTFDVAICN